MDVLDCVKVESTGINTQAGTLILRESMPDQRSRDRESMTFYPAGELKSAYLEGCQKVVTPIGEKKAELITFYKSGAVKRVFPSYGSINGFWSEEEERQMVPVNSVRMLGVEIEGRISCYSFYETGSLKSITLYPGERVEFIWKRKLWKARYGISFYLNGELAAFEPATTHMIELENGIFQAYDSMAVGIHGEGGSLKFYPDGRIKSLKSCVSAICLGEEKKILVEPKKIPSPMDPELMVINPLTYRFENNCIEGTDSFGTPFLLEYSKHTKWSIL